MLSAATPAVDERSTVSPSRHTRAPAATNVSTSSRAIPPSGPTTTTTSPSGGTASRQKQSLWINWLVLASCAVLATAIEMLQVYLPPHVADMTDVLLATVGASLGVLALKFTTRQAR